MFIRTERLFLRPGWPEDCDDLCAQLNDDAAMLNLARDPWPRTAEEARSFIDRPRHRLLPHFFITLPTCDGAKLIGSIGLGRDGDDVEVGYWIARDYRRRGFATESLRAVVAQARALGHPGLVATHFIDSSGASRVLAKAGFLPSRSVCQRYSATRGGMVEANRFTMALNSFGPEAGNDDGGGVKVA